MSLIYNLDTSIDLQPYQNLIYNDVISNTWLEGYSSITGIACSTSLTGELFNGCPIIESKMKCTDSAAIDYIHSKIDPNTNTNIAGFVCSNSNTINSGKKYVFSILWRCKTNQSNVFVSGSFSITNTTYYYGEESTTSGKKYNNEWNIATIVVDGTQTTNRNGIVFLDVYSPDFVVNDEIVLEFCCPIFLENTDVPIDIDSFVSEQTGEYIYANPTDETDISQLYLSNVKWIHNTPIGFGSYKTNANSTIVFESALSFPDNYSICVWLTDTNSQNWYYLVRTIDSSNNIINYINGVAAESTVQLFSSDFLTILPSYIGSFADFSIYNTVLTPLEIENLYNIKCQFYKNGTIKTKCFYEKNNNLVNGNFINGIDKWSFASTTHNVFSSGSKHFNILETNNVITSDLIPFKKDAAYKLSFIAKSNAATTDTFYTRIIPYDNTLTKLNPAYIDFDAYSDYNGTTEDIVNGSTQVTLTDSISTSSSERVLAICNSENTEVLYDKITTIIPLSSSSTGKTAIFQNPYVGTTITATVVTNMSVYICDSSLINENKLSDIINLTTNFVYYEYTFTIDNLNNCTNFIQIQPVFSLTNTYPSYQIYNIELREIQKTNTTTSSSGSGGEPV